MRKEILEKINRKKPDGYILISVHICIDKDRGEIIAKTPWQTKEWKQKRSELLKDAKCERCGSTEKLQIHHPEHAFMPPRVLKLGLYNLFYKQFTDIFEEKYGSRKPIKTGRHRHKSHPAWHPMDRVHKLEVDKSNMEIEYIVPGPTPEEKVLFDTEYKEWLKSIDAEGQIKAILEKDKSRYMSLEDIQIVCSKCHIAGHKGMDLCLLCKKNYKKRHYATCYNCMPEDRKKEIEERKKQDEEFIRMMDELEFEDNDELEYEMYERGYEE